MTSRSSDVTVHSPGGRSSALHGTSHRQQRRETKLLRLMSGLSGPNGGSDMTLSDEIPGPAVPEVRGALCDSLVLLVGARRYRSPSRAGEKRVAGRSALLAGLCSTHES